MGPSRANIAHMFSAHRFVPGKKTVLCIVYFPIGVILTILRIFLGLHVFVISCILPKTFFIRRLILRFMSMLLGIIVSCDSRVPRDGAAKVVVSNHVSVLDHVSFDLLMPSVTPCVWNLSSFLRWALGYADFAAHEGREALILKTKDHCNKSTLPLLTFPEGAMTNGKVGLLKYSTWSFSIQPVVQPVLIRISRPIIPVNVETIGGSLVTDLLWFLFVPFTVIYFRFLPSQTREEGESEDAYAKRVQELMAKELNIDPTPYTNADKSEYVKRKLHIPPRIQARSNDTPPNRPVPPTPPPSPTTPTDGATNNSILELENMVRQVQEVLPHIAKEIIRQDLRQTSCIDTTITNILEERIDTTSTDSDSAISVTPPSFSPGTSSSSSAANTPTEPTAGGAAAPAQSPSAIKFCSTIFGKSSSVRQMSYQERKAALLETARRHYMEKHGMT